MFYTIPPVCLDGTIVHYNWSALLRKDNLVDVSSTAEEMCRQQQKTNRKLDRNDVNDSNHVSSRNATTSPSPLSIK